LIFDPSMPSREIQKRINAVYATQEHNEFGPVNSGEIIRLVSAAEQTLRNALLFMDAPLHCSSV
jgi:hypothetical protein